MPNLTTHQEVMPQTKEYLAISTVEINETVKIKMVFDDDITLENLQLKYFTTTSTGNPPSGDLVVQYPNGNEVTIASGVSQWDMNQEDDNRNMWYSLPPFSSLYWEPTNPAAGLKACLVMSAIGRGI